MSTRLQWSKTGLAIVCETSKRALPRTVWAFALPPFSSLNTTSPGIAAALVTDPVTGLPTGIRVSSLEDLPAGYAYTLSWVSYQGAEPSPLVWTQIALGAVQSFSETLPASSATTYRFRLSRTWQGVTETYSEISLATPVEAAPAAVTGLASFWQGTQAMLQWDRSSDPRGIEYEVRFGPTADTARVIAQLPVGVTSLTYLSNGTYWVATRYRGLYSAFTSITISGSPIVRNVVQTWEEAPAWSGTFTGGAIENADGGLTLNGNTLFDSLVGNFDSLVGTFDDLSGVQAWGEYEVPASHVVDLGTAQPCSVTAVLSFQSRTPGTADARALIATAGDDGVFGGWVPFIPGQFYARKFKFKLRLTSTDSAGSAPVVGSFSWTVDMPDRTETNTGLTTPATGSYTWTYSKPFQIDPCLQITPLNSQSGDVLKIDSHTATSSSFHYENGGSTVARTLNAFAQGY